VLRRLQRRQSPELRVQQRGKATVTIEGGQIVKTANMPLPDKNLRHGAATRSTGQHLIALCIIQIDADFGDFDAFSLQ
jgi:hypothetical protein